MKKIILLSFLIINYSFANITNPQCAGGVGSAVIGCGNGSPYNTRICYNASGQWADSVICSNAEGGWSNIDIPSADPQSHNSCCFPKLGDNNTHVNISEKKDNFGGADLNNNRQNDYRELSTRKILSR